MNLNLVVLTAGGLALLVSFLAIDFLEAGIFGILLLLMIGTVLIGAVMRITFETRQRQQRLAYMSQYGKMADQLIQQALGAQIKSGGARQRAVTIEVAEIIRNMYGRITGDQVWLSVRQVYSDGTDLWVHDVLHTPTGQDAPELNDIEANAAFRMIWGRVRQALHPYYVCGDIEKEWSKKATSLGHTAEEATWPGFYRSLVQYFGRQWVFSYKSMAVLPIGGGKPRMVEGAEEPVITPWGYLAVMSDVPRAFSDPAVRDLGQRSAALLEKLLVPPTPDPSAPKTVDVTPE